jgi:hypothetical protein
MSLVSPVFPKFTYFVSVYVYCLVGLTVIVCFTGIIVVLTVYLINGTSVGICWLCWLVVIVVVLRTLFDGPVTVFLLVTTLFVWIGSFWTFCKIRAPYTVVPHINKPAASGKNFILFFYNLLFLFINILIN